MSSTWPNRDGIGTVSVVRDKRVPNSRIRNAFLLSSQPHEPPLAAGLESVAENVPDGSVNQSHRQNHVGAWCPVCGGEE